MTTCIICHKPFVAKNWTVITCAKACSAARKKQRTDAYNALTAARRRQGGVGTNGRREGDDEAVRRACRKGDAAYAAALEKAGYGRATVAYRAAQEKQLRIDMQLFPGSEKRTDVAGRDLSAVSAESFPGSPAEDEAA